MRLINLETLQIEEFVEYGKVPHYAILSHTWGPEEVTFADMKTKDRDELAQKAGYQKIVRFGQFMKDIENIENVKKIWDYPLDPSGHTSVHTSIRSHQVNDQPTHIWVDTCCIDKSSSAELSEAINSMFVWYQEAMFCVAFIDDYEQPAGEDHFRPDENSFENCRWFSRGWTLQELLAPTHMFFADKNWTFLGSRDDLMVSVSAASGIDALYLHNGYWQKANIAKRLSWAAKRETTRPEDLAYCLLGVFGVHMPLLYGEGGHNAFIRLQEEIVKELDDHSIFAWGRRNNSMSGPWNEAPSVYLGAFASHPSQFRGLGNVKTYPGEEEEPHSVTNKGIRIRLPILRFADKTVAILRCHASDPAGGFMGIYIEPCPIKHGVYCRSSSTPALACISDSLAQSAEVKPIFLLKKTAHFSQSIETMAGITKVSLSVRDFDYTIDCAAPERLWDTRYSTLRLPEQNVSATALISMDTKDCHGLRGPRRLFLLLLRVDPASRWGFPDVGLVAWRGAGKQANTRDLERCHLTNQHFLKPHTAQLRLKGKTVRTITARVGVDMVGDMRTYVVSLTRE